MATEADILFVEEKDKKNPADYPLCKINNSHCPYIDVRIEKEKHCTFSDGKVRGVPDNCPHKTEESIIIQRELPQMVQKELDKINGQQKR